MRKPVQELPVALGTWPEFAWHRCCRFTQSRTSEDGAMSGRFLQTVALMRHLASETALLNIGKEVVS
jgi:hypothetical protein